MKKILKFGLGVVAGLAAAHVAYHGYKTLEEGVLRELTDAVRAHFASRQIDAVWLIDEPVHGAFFEGGVVSGDVAIVFEINVETLEILEKSEEKI